MGMKHDEDDGWRVADPPAEPEGVSPVVVAAGTAAAVGFVALDVATGGLASLIAHVGSLPAPWIDPPAHTPVEMAGTGAPEQRSDGSVVCTRCATAVPYETMSLNEHGYFCAACGPSQPA